MVLAGYKLFRLVLPIWGFFFGFLLGVQTIQVLFNVGFLATITSWVAGFIVGLIFAVLAYPFYLFGVAIIAASLGYFATVGLWLWLGLSFGFVMWLIAIVVAIALAAVTLIYNLQRLVIIIATAILGAGLIAEVITAMFKPHALLLENPVKVMLQTSPWLLILFLFLVIFGIIVQFRTTRSASVAVPSTPVKSTMAPPAVTGQATPGAVVAGAAGMAVVDQTRQAPPPVETVAPESTSPVIPTVVTATPVSDSTATPTPPEEIDKFKYNLEYIEGIGPVYAAKLKAIGINNPLDLLEKGAFPKGRDEIAAATGISPSLGLTWVNHVDLFRIKGVGSEYADLLEEAGVDTVVELGKRNPENLFAKMVSLNEEKKLVRKLPVFNQVRDWVEQAKTLPRKINY